MRIITIHEWKSYNENKNSVVDYIKYPNLVIKHDENDRSFYYMFIDNKKVGEYSFSSPLDFMGKTYLPIQTVFVEKEFRNKGIYSAVIEAGKKYALSIGLSGVVSFPFDTDSGEFERSSDANLFWKSQVIKNKAKGWKSADEGGIVYITI